MMQAFALLGAFLWGYLLFWTTYDLVLSFAALFFRKQKVKKGEGKRNFVIVIPAYKEGLILVDTVTNALSVDYPKNQFEVVVLAQDLEEPVLQQLRSFPIKIVATGSLGSKLNALKNWMQNASFQDHTYVFVLDADNLIEKEALITADYFLDQFDVIQLERIKTPPTSSLGILDRWNTAIGLALSNDSRVVLGLNTFLLGSGFSIQANLYKKFVLNAAPTIAEDKALDLFLMEQHKTVGFTKASGIHDSTVERQNVFNAQRARWVGGKIEARKMSRDLLKKYPTTLEFWDKVIHYSAPQRSILIPMIIVGVVFNSFLGFTSISKWLFWTPLLFSVVTILNTTPRQFFSLDLIKAVFAIPGSVLGIVKARWFAKQTVKEDFKVTPK